LALRQRGERQASDERVLGDGDFVEAVWSEADEHGKENQRIRRKKEALSSLAERVCRGHGVTVEELCSGSRRHAIVEGRRDFCRVAIMGYGYSGTEVARFLGVTNSCVLRPVSSTGGLDLDELMNRYK
jgi:putative transposase